MSIDVARINSLRSARLTLGLTQRQLSRRARVAVRTIQGVETYQWRPRQDTQRKLLKALGVPWAQRDLVFTKETPSAPSQEPLQSSLQVQPES